MSTEQELKELIGLVDRHGNACENFGDYQTIKNADVCIEIRKGIETRLRAILAELDAAREDAARYKYLKKNHVRYWVSTIGGLDSMDFDFEANGSDIDAAIDAARNGEA